MCIVMMNDKHQTLNKSKSFKERILNNVLMLEIFVNLACINQTMAYSEHKNWYSGVLV
jgi:hypothetical protein